MTAIFPHAPQTPPIARRLGARLVDGCLRIPVLLRTLWRAPLIAPALLGLAVSGGATAQTGGDAQADAQTALVEAVARARATLPEFYALHAAAPPDTQRYLLRVALPLGQGGTEDIWCTLIRRDGQAFFGTLASDPVALDLPRGSAIAWTDAQITDWMYFGDDDLMYGAFTLHAVLPHLPQDAAATLAAQLAPLAGQGDQGADGDAETNTDTPAENGTDTGTDTGKETN